MSVFSGFGANYKAAQANWAADARYFKAIGLQNIRINLVQSANPWSAGSPNINGTAADINAFWRSAAVFFASQGFYVTWGMSGITGMGSFGSGQLTATLYTALHDAVVAEATYLQQQGIALGDFELGNEWEGYIDGTTLTASQLRADIRQLAADVKAVYTLSPISYGSSNTGSTWAGWVSDGTLGSLDSISLHAYGSIDLTALTVSANSLASMSSIISTFGVSKVYLSEFNLSSNSTSLAALPAATAVSAMSTLFSTYITGQSLVKYLVYTFVGNLNSDNQYAQLYMSGAMNPMWFTFFTSQPMYRTPRSTTAIARSRVSRSNVSRSTVDRRLIFS